MLLHFYTPDRLTKAVRIGVALLAGVPSVVLGLWGLTRVVPWITGWGGQGESLLAAILVLTLMILPTVVLTTDAAIASVDPAVRRGAAALGLSRPATALALVVPAAWRPIGAGWVLALGRAIGETMVVLMVAGNVVQLPSGLVEPVRTLTANIALEMGDAMGIHRPALFASGLLLVGLVAVAAIIVAAWPAREVRRD